MILCRRYYHFKRKCKTDVFASGVKEVAQSKKNRVLDLKYFSFLCAQSTVPLKSLIFLACHVNTLLRGLFVSVALRTPSRQMRWSQRPQVMWYPLPQEVALKSWYRWHRNFQKRQDILCLFFSTIDCWGIHVCLWFSCLVLFYSQQRLFKANAQSYPPIPTTCKTKVNLRTMINGTCKPSIFHLLYF